MKETLLKVIKEGEKMRVSIDCPGSEIKEALSYLILSVMKCLKYNGADDELMARTVCEAQIEAFERFYAKPEGQANDKEH